MTFRFYSNAEVPSSLLVKSWHLVLAQPSLPPSSDDASPQPGSGWVCQGNRTAEVGDRVILETMITLGMKEGEPGSLLACSEEY